MRSWLVSVGLTLAVLACLIGGVTAAIAYPIAFGTAVLLGVVVMLTITIHDMREGK